MKTKQHDILDKLGKDSGFKVPENYFEEFNQKMLDSLPEITITDTEKPTSLWIKARPFIYMAAMFVGVFLMITMFKMTNNTSDSRKAENEATKFIEQPVDNTQSPSILNYEDSVKNNIPQSTDRRK